MGEFRERIREMRGRTRRPGWVTVATACVALAGPAPLAAQAPPLTPADYGQWERLTGFDLDPTGRWLAVSIVRVDESREVRLRRSDGSGEPTVLEHAAGATFDRTGRWVAFRQGVSPEEEEASEERVRDRLGILDLETGADTVLLEVASFRFRDDGAWLAALGIPDGDSVGADLVVMDPLSGARTVIGNVAEYSWQDEGRLLAATLRTASGFGNGTVLYDPEAETLRTLDAREASYRSLTWEDGSSRLAVLRSVDGDGFEEESHDVLLWGDPATSRTPRVLSGEDREGVDGPLRITEYAGIDFSGDGRTLFVGVRPWEASAEGEEDAEDDDAVDQEGAGAAEGEGGSDGADDGADDDEPGPADVQVWHWNDDEILRAQEYRARQLSRRTLAAAWHLDDDHFIVLGDELEEPVRIVADGRWGVVPDYDPYLFERRFGSGAADWYRVDTRTGERTTVATGLDFGPSSHDERSHLLLFDGRAWSSIDLDDLSRTTIGEGRSFVRPLDRHDYPGPRPAWGVGAWIDDRNEVLLYDEHDVWLADLDDGGLERLTSGAQEGREYRVVNLDPDAGFFSLADLDRGERPWLSVRDVRTKASGYARMSWSGGVEVEVWEDALVAGLSRARDADRLALAVQRWDDSPDVFVGDADLDDLVQVTETNPFQADFAWGHTELLDYTTDAGHELQAILAYPAGFEEGRRYPLILYQYERLSDGLHTYHVPSERDYYDFQTWSQRGYFVLMPDIVYEPGRPGPSALDAVEHALDAAVATGHVDPDRMGLIGHSWGGYQASYLPTRTDRFAASVAGAAITNFLSFMGAVHWNGGLPETGHWETGQARMAVPYWEDLDGHLESSPAHFIADLDTPMLLMHGDEDGVVDFYQGLEFYNYARRAGKEVVLLVYPGADHGLSDEAQQVDYHRRILEWFDHYLKGEPAPKWISKGETWVEREKRMNGRAEQRR